MSGPNSAARIHPLFEAFKKVRDWPNDRGEDFAAACEARAALRDAILVIWPETAEDLAKQVIVATSGGAFGLPPEFTENLKLLAEDWA